jgi:hypothetical protein
MAGERGPRARRKGKRKQIRMIEKRVGGSTRPLQLGGEFHCGRRASRKMPLSPFFLLTYQK